MLSRLLPGSCPPVWRLKCRLPVAAFCLLLSRGSPAPAGVLAFWDFENTASASSVADGLAAGTVTISSGSISYQAGADDGGALIGNASTWSTNEFAPTGKYIEFSVTPDDGIGVQVTNVTIRLGRTDTGPLSFTAQYSLDGFATAGILTGSDTITSENTGALDGFVLSAPASIQAGPVTYRVWGHNATSTGNMRFNNVRIYGIVDTGLKPEPSVHATGFGVSLATHRTIVLEWTDAVSGDLPDGYLVRGSKTGFDHIPDPVDGVNVANAIDWSGDGYANKITQGTGLDTLTRLSAGQTYYFKLFPYANQFSTIDYKSDGSVPQVMVTTTTAPFEDMEDFEKPAYEAADVTLKSGTWLFEGAMQGIALGDKRHDQRSARLGKDGCITTLFDVTNVETLLLDHAYYGDHTNSRFVLQCSIDGGSSWQQVGEEVVCGVTLQTAQFKVHNLAAFRLRIRNTAVADEKNVLNIDNIRFTPFEHEGSVIRFR